MECCALASCQPLLLIVDDDSLISESLSFTAFAQEYDVLTSHSRSHARSLVRQLRNPPPGPGRPWPAALPHRPDEGFALIGDLLALTRTSRSSCCPARATTKMPATRAPSAPSNSSPNPAIRPTGRTFPAGPAFRRPASSDTAGGLVGESLPMQRLRLQLGQYADLAYPVLIEANRAATRTSLPATTCTA